MGSGSGQDSAVWSVYTFCGGEVVDRYGESIPCYFDGVVDVHFRDGDAAWTCVVCGYVKPVLVALFLFGVVLIFAGCALVWPVPLTLTGLAFMAPLPLIASIAYNERSKS